MNDAKRWNAAKAYGLEAVIAAGHNVLDTCAGYLLRLAKLDPKCSRRDDRRAIIPLATSVHCAIWRAATAWTAALPGDTDKVQWDKAIEALIEAAKVTACERAEKARAKRAAEKAEKAKAAKGEGDEGTEGDTGEGEKPDPRSVVADAVVALIAALSALPPDQRAAAARRAASEIVSKFE